MTGLAQPVPLRCERREASFPAFGVWRTVDPRTTNGPPTLLIKWMFAFWVPTAVGVIALLFR